MKKSIGGNTYQVVSEHVNHNTGVEIVNVITGGFVIHRAPADKGSYSLLYDAVTDVFRWLNEKTGVLYVVEY